MNGIETYGAFRSVFVRVGDRRDALVVAAVCRRATAGPQPDLPGLHARPAARDQQERKAADKYRVLQLNFTPEIEVL